jgi:hypothetical protein
MKLLNNPLQNQMEYLSQDKSKQHFKEYLQSILEDTSTPYYKRADYLGLSLQGVQHKIDDIAKHITELQNHKKKLTIALNIAKELSAEVLHSNGIDRIDGNIISSLTLTKASTKTKDTIEILDEKKVIELGYVKFSVDKDAVMKTMIDKESMDELDKYVSVSSITTTTPSKVKVNTKRTPSNKEIDEIVIEQQAA